MNNSTLHRSRVYLARLLSRCAAAVARGTSIERLRVSVNQPDHEPVEGLTGILPASWSAVVQPA